MKKHSKIISRVVALLLTVIMLSLSLVTIVCAEDGYQYEENYWSVDHSINSGESLYFTLWRYLNGTQYYYDNLINMGSSREILQIHDSYIIESSVYDSNGDGINDKVFMFTASEPLLERLYDHRTDYYYNFLCVWITIYGNDSNYSVFDDIKGVVNSYKGEDQQTYYAHGICFDTDINFECNYTMTIYLHDKTQENSFRCKYDINGTITVGGNNNVITDYLLYNLDRNRSFYTNEKIYLNTWENRLDINKRVYYNLLQRYTEKIDSNDSLIPITLSPYQNNMVYENMGVTDFSQSGDVANDFFVWYTIEYDSMQYEPQNKKYYDSVYIFLWFHDIDKQGLTYADFQHTVNTDLYSNGLHSLTISKACKLDCTLEYQFFNGDFGFNMFTEFDITIVGGSDGGDTPPIETTPPIIPPDDYASGYNDALTIYNFMGAILKAPITFINEALSFDVFGVNVLNFVRVLITCAIVFFVVRWALKRSSD